jgi:hypothetical protein
MTKPLNRYVASVTIEAETLEDAEQVLAERLGYDEDYGFPYALTYNGPQPMNENPSETVND